MKITQLPAWFAAVTALALAGCSSVSVHTDYDHSRSFQQYRTYTLTPATNGLTLSPSGDTALRESLRTHLAARGITEAVGQPADLEVVSHVFAHDETSVQQYTAWGYTYAGAWPYRRGRYTMWTGAPVTYTDVRNYTSGTLMLDFIDAQTQRLVFRGTGEGPAGSPRANAKSITKAVKKIVSRLPTPSAPK